MNNIRGICTTAITGIAVVLIAVVPCVAGELATKSCAELVRMAHSYQQDLATVDTVLGSAIDAGTMDRIRAYKLRKAAVKRQLKSVLRVIKLKDCTVPQ